MFNLLIPFNVFRSVLFGVLFFYLTGCGISKRTTVPSKDSTETMSEEKSKADRHAINNDSIPTAVAISSSVENITSIEKQLQNAHQKWQATPYRYGGNGNNGVDCSAFTQIVFRDFFDKDLPRNTRSQLQVGSGVRRRSIQSGDLVFFKTGRKSLHVGISMGDGDFLHASVSSGVMISNIGERYWANRYLGARRVF